MYTHKNEPAIMTHSRASCPESKINARVCVILTRYLVRLLPWRRKDKSCFLPHGDAWWKCPALCVKMRHAEYHTNILWFLKLGSRLTMKCQLLSGAQYEEMHTNKIEVCFWMSDTCNTSFRGKQLLHCGHYTTFFTTQNFIWAQK